MYKLVKDCLPAVLSVTVDGKKLPLTVIGKSKRANSFLKAFNPIRDLRNLYFQQSNAWSACNLWLKQINKINCKANQQQQKFFHLNENYAAHIVDSNQLSHFNTPMLPLKAPLALKRIDSGIGRLSKADLRRLLASLILSFIKKDNSSGYRSEFKLADAVTVHDEVRLISALWNLEPRSVVANV